ncbi:LGFP repeat-containing protein [Allokutzneria oryzae]|uniref:LGFP repeat-containing protein n=1 Tax=Allokutzneria oryzae TaxID=1378989 RepID=A0ABV6A7E5_9PSEU
MSTNNFLRRAFIGVALGIALVASSGMVAAPTAFADGDYCGRRVLGAIEQHYLEQGGPTGIYGCPTSAERLSPDGKQIQQEFRCGRITYFVGTGTTKSQYICH